MASNEEKKQEEGGGEGSSNNNNNVRPYIDMVTPKPDWLDKLINHGNYDLHFIHYTSIQPYIDLADQYVFSNIFSFFSSFSHLNTFSYGDLLRFTLSRGGENVLISKAEYILHSIALLFLFD